MKLVQLGKPLFGRPVDSSRLLAQRTCTCSGKSSAFRKARCMFNSHDLWPGRLLVGSRGRGGARSSLLAADRLGGRCTTLGRQPILSVFALSVELA